MGLGSSDLYCAYANPCCSAREINSTIIHKRPSFKRTQVTRIFSRKPKNEFNFRLLFWLFIRPCTKKKQNKTVNYIPKIHGESLWISSFLKLSQTAIPANTGSNLAVLCLKTAVTLVNCFHRAHLTTVIPFYPPPVQVSYNIAIIYRAKTELNWMGLLCSSQKELGFKAVTNPSQ